MLEPIIPNGFALVKDPSELAMSGSRGARLFFKGDTLEIGDQIFSKIRTDKDGKEVIKDGKPVLVYYIAVSINGCKPIPVAMASFRRFPRDVNAFLDAADASLMRELFNGSDEDRYNFLKGKTLEVLRTVEGEAIDWTKTSQASDGTYYYKTSKFAVFAVKK